MNEFFRPKGHRTGLHYRVPYLAILPYLTIAALVAALTATAPAGAALNSSDQAQLEAREAELQTTIGNMAATIEDLEAERSQLLIEIDTHTAAIEGTADALERLALSRREPARVQVNIAIERFLNGDPASETVARELQALSHDDGPIVQQEAMGSVIDQATEDLAIIDASINSLAAGVPELRNDRTAAANRLTTVDALLLELRFEIDELRVELVQVSADLEWYRNASRRSPLSGRDNPHGNARPALVVKIDNVPRARPQAGVNDADVVFVELVEGGATRLAAAFHSEDPATIGPVRSMRTTDVKLLQMLRNPLFANSGGNQRTTSIVNSSPLVNIGHATGAGGAYYRNNSRPAPHNLYTSAAALRRAGGSSGGQPIDLFQIRRPGTALPNAAQAAEAVTVRYKSTTVSYSWNGTGWARTQDGAAFRDSAGTRVAPETVIVQFTNYGVSPADKNSPEAIATGSGAAWIFTEGKVIKGTWSKPRARDVTVYTDANGDQVELLPGRVWIELPKPGGASSR